MAGDCQPRHYRETRECSRRVDCKRWRKDAEKRMWKWFEFKTCWGCLIPKNCSTSLKQASKGVGVPPPGAVKFAIIRNPYERLVSAWVDKRDHWQQYLGLDDFIDLVDFVARTGDEHIDIHLRSQVRFLDPWPDILIPMHQATERLGEMGIKLGNLNRRSRHHWTRYYNDDLMAIVRKRYAEDFDLCAEFE